MTMLRRITVDLTPLLPGGANGGAKLVARALVQHMAALAPETEFTLLTSLANHADCADLERQNVQRTCVELEAPRGALAALRASARVTINTLVPPGMRGELKDRLWLVLKRQRRAAAMSTAALADLVFCPFTAPYFFDPRVPLVSLVHDLQHLDMPEFFGGAVAAHRNQHFVDACRTADRLVCVSDFVRESVLRHAEVPPGRLMTIHSTALRTCEPGASAAPPLARRYLLYPANVWPHKNHARLLEAFATFVRSHPESDLGLVCTGAPGPGAEDLTARARRQLPSGRFAFLGFLAEPEFAAILHGCRGLIFPSLYEGFGLPVLEAMAVGKPVLCSNVTSLPEVAGDAALMFDPYDVAAMAEAIARLEHTGHIERTLVERGRARVRAFGTPAEWAARYLSAFEDAVRSHASAAAGAPSR